jgi:hypothetical protein
MGGAIHPLPKYAFMVWCLVKAQGQIYLYLYLYIPAILYPSVYTDREALGFSFRLSFKLF